MILSRALVAVVDDDESVRKALSRLLRSADTRVVTYAGAEEYLEAANTNPADCLVLDVHMPGMNGLALQAELAQHEPGIPIIFITAQDDADLRAKALAGGASGYFVKPFNEEALIESIQTAIAGKPRSE